MPKESINCGDILSPTDLPVDKNLCAAPFGSNTHPGTRSVLDMALRFFEVTYKKPFPLAAPTRADLVALAPLVEEMAVHAKDILSSFKDGPTGLANQNRAPNQNRVPTPPPNPNDTDDDVVMISSLTNLSSGIDTDAEALPSEYNDLIKLRVYIPLVALTTKAVRRYHDDGAKMSMAKLPNRLSGGKGVLRPDFSEFTGRELDLTTSDFTRATENFLALIRIVPKWRDAVVKSWEKWFARIKSSFYFDDSDYYFKALMQITRDALINWNKEGEEATDISHGPPLDDFDLLLTRAKERVARAREAEREKRESYREPAPTDSSFSRTRTFARRDAREASPTRFPPSSRSRDSPSKPFSLGGRDIPSNASRGRCVICGAPDHIGANCRSHSLSHSNSPTIVIWREGNIWLRSDTRKRICFSWNIRADGVCSNPPASAGHGDHRCSLCLSNKHGAQKCNLS